ncbi:hypothetical protein [Thalassobellus suaedae]|uniref:Uncharacterized protein n=1 Tax=Thalassobellus suaedae TaxID=3074124 RepID=A0ABY9Y710_9FLAO|nr:hypothetical protein RHP49_06235 [Flavobacteriaceae bacterium HL-DH10]
MENRLLLIELNQGIPKTQKEINIIKKDFLLNDIRHKEIVNNGETPTLDLNESNIQAEVVVGKSKRTFHDEFGFEREVVDLEYEIETINFYEEFDKALNISFDEYCSKFIKELDRKGVYTSESIEGFKKNQLKKINDLITYLNQSSDFEAKDKALIIQFCEKLYDFSSNFKSEDFQISDKLKFKLNKNQVIWLFQSMYDKNVISGITHPDLFRFLDDYCEYFDKAKYHQMSNSRIQANKFINGHASPKESIKALNEKFDKDFFSSSI